MIFRFKILSEEIDTFRREIKIDAGSSFLDLQNAILDSCGYTRDEMTSFFICDADWRKEQEITLIPMDTDSETDNYVMSDTRLEEFLEDEGQHLLFVFDYLSERAFFMELAEIITRESLSEPLVTKSVGQPPKQTSTIEVAEARSMAGLVVPGSSSRKSDGIFDDDDDLYADEDLDEEDLLSLDEVSPEDMY